MNNPETDMPQQRPTIPKQMVSEFSLGSSSKESQHQPANTATYHRVKAADAAHEISQVMQAAAAKSQRDVYN